MSALKSKTRASTLPLGCDSEKTGTLDTEHGPIVIRTRRWPFCDGRYTRFDVAVKTPKTAADGDGFRHVGDADDLAGRIGASAEVNDHGTAQLVASEYVRRVAASRPMAADRAPVKTDRRGPDAAGDAEPRPSSPRQKPPGYKNRGAALHAMLGACGYPSREHNSIATAALGREVTSLGALTQTEDALVRAFADSRVPA